MKAVVVQLKSFIKGWDQFWFKPGDAFGLACFRSLFCLCLLVFYSIRFFDIRVFFYESGLMTAQSAKALHTMASPYVLNVILSSDILLYVCYLGLLACLLLMALGLGGRLAAIAAFVLHLVFIQRNPSLVYQADTLAVFWLFYLMFAKGGGELNWVNYFMSRRKKGLVSDRRPAASLWNTTAVRLVQVQLCVVYAFSAFAKLEGDPFWRDGSVFASAGFFYDMAVVDYSYFLNWPVLSALAVCFIIVFELYFPVLVWAGKWRPLVLSLGVLLHAVLALCLGLWFFSLFMLCAYVLFMPAPVLRRFFARLQT